MDLMTELRGSIAKVCGLPVEAVASTANLADLGVDSLASAEVITDLEIKLGQDLPLDVLRRLNEARTVGDVEAVIAQAFGPGQAGNQASTQHRA